MWQNAGKAGLDQWNFTLLPTSRSQARSSDGSLPNQLHMSLVELSYLESSSTHRSSRESQGCGMRMRVRQV